MIGSVDTMSLARAERSDLADLLASLTPQQWDAPTLCALWRVREVVAHVYSYEDVSLGRVVARMVRNGFDSDRSNALGVAAYADLTGDELAARAREHVQPTGLTAMMGGKIALTDGLIHQQDIRRPLGLPRDVPADRLVAALETARRAPTIKAAARIRGLTLTATDLDWTTGTGPAVEGPGEALLLAVAGRMGIVDELSGAGTAILRERIGG